MRIPFDKVEQGTILQTAFFYGTFRAGKTHFCSTFPRVAWLGAAREGGYKTIKYMSREAFYEPERPPQIYTLTGPSDLMQHLQRDIMPQIKAGEIKTVVLELSVYTDDMIRKSGMDGWAKYGALSTHISDVDDMLKGSGARIIYNALAAAEEDRSKPSQVMMAGKALSRSLPAMMDMIAYLRADSAEDGATVRYLHLAPFSNFPAGHRYGAGLPAIVKNPSFRILEQLINREVTCDSEGNIVAKPKLAPLK